MHKRLAIGIDIGATRTKIGLVDSSAHIYDIQTLQSHLTSEESQPFLDEITAVIKQIILKHPIQGIGVALCSLINPEHTGAYLSVNAPALNNLNIKYKLETDFNCPVNVINDVNAHALAEYRFGAGREVNRLLCVALGTGIAIAVINDGKLVEIWGGVAADAARIILDPTAEVICNGKVHGSAEALCGIKNIERLARIKYQRDEVTASEVIEACRVGNDPIACQIMEEIGSYLGHLLAILSPVFFPQKIVVNGGTAEAGESFFIATREHYFNLIGEYMLNIAELESGLRKKIEINKGELGPEAGTIGAALIML